MKSSSVRNGGCRSAILVALLACLASVLALAFAGGRCVAAGPLSGVGVFFDSAGSQIARNGITAFVPFDFYVVAHDSPEGLRGYEFSLRLPPGLVVAGGRQLPAGFSDSGVGDDNWIVTTGGECLSGFGPVVLVRYATALFLALPSGDLTVCLAGAIPSRVSGGAPGYEACAAGGQLHPFDAAYAGCAVIDSAYTPCEQLLDHETISVGHGEAAAGAPVSLLVRSVPWIRTICHGKLYDSINVTRVEFDVSWDPSVASLSGARWYGDSFPDAQVELTAGEGVATVVVQRASWLFDAWRAAPLLWLDFLTAVQPGQTDVSVHRAVLDTSPPQQILVETAAGSIVTATVPTAGSSFGALKARWREGP